MCLNVKEDDVWEKLRRSNKARIYRKNNPKPKKPRKDRGGICNGQCLEIAEQRYKNYKELPEKEQVDTIFKFMKKGLDELD